MIESIITTAAIDAKEGRDRAIMDLPGAFLHVWSDEKAIVFMKEKFSELIVSMAPQIYRKYTTTTKVQCKYSIHESAKGPV